MTRTTLTQLLAALVLALCLAVSGVLGVELAASAGRNRLVYTDRISDADPPQVAAGIAMGAFRGLFVNFLWIRANDLKEEGRFYEAIDLARAITKLQPRFPQVWVFHAWNMAYNISVSTQTPRERWQWVNAGIALLRDQGIPANPNDLLIHKELAWIFLHKIGGYMDDANLFYKRQLAAEWTLVLGPPPPPDSKDRDRAHATAKFADWLRPIVESPENAQDVIKAEPLSQELVHRLRAEAGVEPGMDMLAAYATTQAIAGSGVRKWYESRMRPPEKAVLALYDDPKYAKAWKVLIAFERRRVLEDQYHMEPERMLRYTEEFGPLDWRHYGAHALYWGNRGVENALQRVVFENRRDFDFVNSGRIVVQALQELWRCGDLSFDFLGWVRSNSGQGDVHVMWRGSPNVHFIDSYGDHIEAFINTSWADGKNRVYSLYAAGYENFRKDAIRFLYRRGEVERAKKMKDELAKWEHRNINDNERDALFTLPIDDFVKKELEDALNRPSVAREEIVGSIQGAFVQGLLAGDRDLYDRQMAYAKRVHDYFFSQQNVKNSLDPNQLRMEQISADFGLVVGFEFAALLSELDLDDAEKLYDAVPQEIRLYGYDPVIARFKEPLDELAKGGGRTFAQVFPEPTGIEAHRQRMKDLEEKRSRLPGVELK
jgi:hypothetical protein